MAKKAEITRSCPRNVSKLINLTVLADVARVVGVTHVGDLRRIPNAFAFEHPHVELQADQCEYGQNEACEDHDISQANDRLEQRVNDCFQALDGDKINQESFLKSSRSIV